MATTQLEFPTQAAMESTDARRRYLRFRYRLAEDQRYHFSIVLPCGWRVDTAVPVAPSADQPVQVPATFVVARGQRSRAEVLVFHLARDVAPVDWLDILLEQRKEEVLARREAGTPGGTCADVLTRITATRGPIVSRWMVMKTGATLFLVHCSTPENEYPQNARDFAAAVSGFRLLQPSGWPFAEPMHLLTMPILGNLEVLLPRSWSLRRDESPSSRAMAFSAINGVGTAPLGHLALAGITGAAESSADGVVGRYLDELRRNQVGIHQMPLKTASAKPPFAAAWQGQVKGLRQGGRVEVRAFVGRCEAGWLMVGVLGPPREENVWAWAVNKRALEIAAENVQAAKAD